MSDPLAGVTLVVNPFSPLPLVPGTKLRFSAGAAGTSTAEPSSKPLKRVFI